MAIETLRTKDDPAAVAAVVGLCSSADAALMALALQRARFSSVAQVKNGELDSSTTDAPANARWITNDRNLYCKGREHDGGLRCRDFCIKRWSALTVSIDALRARASVLGVSIESLRSYAH